MRILIAFISLISLMLWHLNAKAGQSSTTCTLAASTINAEIHRDGAHKTYEALAKDDLRWKALIVCIAIGDAGWVRAASSLYTEADGSGAEGIATAVGEALGNQPENVLKITQHEFSLGLTLEQICATPDIEDQRFDSYVLATKEISRREHAISNIKDKELLDDVDSCRTYLEEAKKRIAQILHRPLSAARYQ